MYTESTTEKKAETNPENREGEEREEEAELEEEKEKRLLLLIIEGCCRVIPEEDPAEVTELIIKAVEIFTAEWVREAINEAALCNKRNLLGILEILDSWMKQGHNKTSRRSMADYASNLGTASH